MFHFLCPHCSAELRRPVADAGKEIECGRCRLPVIVPKGEPKEGLPVPPITNVVLGPPADPVVERITWVIALLPVAILVIVFGGLTLFAVLGAVRQAIFR